MRKITVFNYVSVDGCYAGPQGEIDWFKFITKDDTFNAFINAQATVGSTLMMGHITYEMMKQYWPSDDAAQMDQHMANVMNNSQKIVFSKTLTEEADGSRWKNVRVMNAIQAEEILAIKAQEGNDITIIGSGTVVQQLTNLGLIDGYTLLVVPVILGNGKHLFEEVKMTNLSLVEARSFQNGITWLNYKKA